MRDCAMGPPFDGGGRGKVARAAFLVTWPSPPAHASPMRAHAANDQAPPLQRTIHTPMALDEGACRLIHWAASDPRQQPTPATSPQPPNRRIPIMDLGTT